MPLFDYRCPECERIQGEFIHHSQIDATVIACEACGVQMKRIMSGAVKHTTKVGSFFEPYIDTDIRPDGQPIKIETQQQFFTECEKHGRGYRPIRDKLR